MLCSMPTVRPSSTSLVVIFSEACIILLESESGSSVSTVTRLSAETREIVVGFPTERKYLSLLRNVQRGSGAYKPSYSLGVWGPVLRVKQSGCTAERLTSSYANNKNAWRYTSNLNHQVFIYHQLLHFIHITSNMFRLRYPAIIRELIIVHNQQLVASHTMAVTHMLQFIYVCYIDLCSFKIIKKYVHRISRIYVHFVL
jgi:hypothetical protein